jgi:RNA polymerase sigma-70 factor, ECF subfamily
MNEEESHLADSLEHEWLRQAQQGERDAFEHLQALLEPAIRRFVRRLIGSGWVEDDVVQDTFIALYKNLARIDPVENLRPYVFRIARNRCYDELRQQKRFDVVSLDDEATALWVSFTEAADNGPPPDELTHWLLLNLEVQEAMERLPEMQRETLILYSEHDLSYSEIADITGTSVGTVKSRLYYARKNLYGLLRPATVKGLEVEFNKGSEA